MSPEEIEIHAKELERLLFKIRNNKIGAYALVAMDTADHIIQISHGASTNTVSLTGAIELMKRDVMAHAPTLCPCMENPDYDHTRI